MNSRDLKIAALGNKYAGRAVTLHGKPAKIVRDAEGRAWVAPLDPELGSVPYSWSAVVLVCDSGNGKF